MDIFSVRIVLGWLVALLLSKMVHGDLESVLESCCKTGEAWALNSTTCTGMEQDGLPCLTSAYACCARARRRADCLRGKEAARAGAPCGSEDSPYRDCCDGCKLGVQAKSHGLPCVFARFSFGASWDETYRDCCERTSYEQVGVTQQNGRRPILELVSSTIEEGDDVYFHCDISEFNTNPRIFNHIEMGWRFEGQQLVINESAGVIASRLTQRSRSQMLAIRKVQRKNRGRYSCTTDGAESNQVYLRVQFRPVCKSGQQTTYETKLHHPVEITCEVEADPENITYFRWEFNSSSGSAPPVQPTYQLVPVPGRGRMSVVHFTPHSEHDYGTLSCRANNSLGSQREPCLFVIKPDDQRPIFANYPLPMQAVVPVNASPGTPVFTLRAAFIGTDDVRYFLAQNHSRFEVDELSGDVLTVGSEPFELEKEYVLWVAAGDGMSRTEEERLSIMGGWRPPQFYRTEYGTTIPSNQAKDADIIEVKAKSFSDKKIRYILRAQGSGAGVFKINNTNGVVRLAKDLKFKIYWLIVRAYEDITSFSSSVQLIINVTDATIPGPADPQVYNVNADKALEASTVLAPRQYIRPDELQMELTHLPEVEGKAGVRVRLLSKFEDYPLFSFHVRYRKKGESVWKSSPPEDYEDFIDVHLLDFGSLYEFFVTTVYGHASTSSKKEEFQTRMDPRVEEELNNLFKNTMKMLDKTGDS